MMPGWRREWSRFTSSDRGWLAKRNGVDSQFIAAMKIIGIIPARYASTRFPGKPLHLIAGKPLIQHVVEQCQKAKSLDKVVVATDDTQIWEVTQQFCDVEMTRPEP